KEHFRHSMGAKQHGDKGHHCRPAVTLQQAPAPAQHPPLIQKVAARHNGQGAYHKSHRGPAAVERLALVRPREAMPQVAAARIPTLGGPRGHGSKALPWLLLCDAHHKSCYMGSATMMLLQAASQESLLERLPSSHSSSPFVMPSPQRGPRVQSALQPSYAPSLSSPASHCSPNAASREPSPQEGGKTHPGAQASGSASLRYPLRFTPLSQASSP